MTPRSLRAAVDMNRIRAASAGDTLIESMLAKAFSAMAAGVRNHASDFLPGGLFAHDQHTPDMRERLNGVPTTSTGAERVFALGRFHDARAGFTRPENCDGVILGGMDNTVGWLREQANAEGLWGAARKVGRQGLATTQAASHRDEGLTVREGRQARLQEKHAKRAAKTEAKEKLERLMLAKRYSELVDMGMADLQDQLNKRKLAGAKGYNVTQPNRTAAVLQLQSLLLEADPAANDLPEGDSGIKGRLIQRRVAGGKRKKGKLQTYEGYEWTVEEENDFEVDALVGRLVADGTTRYANQGVASAGTVLYRVVWSGDRKSVV